MKNNISIPINFEVICKVCSTRLSKKRLTKHMKLNHPDVFFAEMKKKKQKKGISNININAVNQKSRNGILMLMDKIYLESKTIYVIWEDIYFEKDFIKFSPTRLNLFIEPIKVIGVFKELNSIKKEYFERLHGDRVYKLKLFKNILLIDESSDWEDILETIDFVKDLHLFKISNKSIVGPPLTNKLFKSLYKNSIEKNKFISHLASVQDSIFNIIPINEIRRLSKEESFIFRMRTCNENVLFIWENTKIGRATHLFLCSFAEHKKTLKAIESFICTSMQYKRSLLYLESEESHDIRKKLSYFTTFKHINIDDNIFYLKDIIENY